MGDLDLARRSNYEFSERHSPEYGSQNILQQAGFGLQLNSGHSDYENSVDVLDLYGFVIHRGV
jgi:hypothetical protein